MYITETNENVKKLFEEIEKLEDVNKLRFLIYIFGLLNNNQINDKNEANPDLIDNDDINIFTFTSLGFSENANTIFLQYLVMIYNILTSSKDAYEDNGNVLGIKLDECIIIQDSIYGVKAAISAGARIVVGLPDSLSAKYVMETFQFDQYKTKLVILNSLKDFDYSILDTF